jgi:alpha-L-fucosidase 2
MICQSHDGSVNLLPALPDAWKAEGEVKGLKTRGGFEIVDLRWKEGKIVKLIIKSSLGGNLRLRLPEPLKGYKKARGINPNPMFQFPKPKAVLSKAVTKVVAVDLPKTWLYDISTQKEETITIK